MSKTPEEIKRGLECCLDEAEGLADCTDYPYVIVCSTDFDTSALERDALAYIRQLEAEREELQKKLLQAVIHLRDRAKMSQWISAETLPEDYERYIVWDGNQIEVADYWGDGKWANHRFGVMICGVTHYMPLPKVPKEDKQHGL